MTEHTHTDKTLQGNDKIESAIAALQQEPSQEMLAHVLTVIRRRMNEHGELIIAVDPSSAASGLQIQAIQTDDGRKWWAAFTSFDEELKGSGSSDDIRIDSYTPECLSVADNSHISHSLRRRSLCKRMLLIEG